MEPDLDYQEAEEVVRRALYLWGNDDEERGGIGGSGGGGGGPMALFPSHMEGPAE